MTNSTGTVYSLTPSAKPRKLPSRLEVRRLRKDDFDHALAVFMHSNAFHQPILNAVYPNQTAKSWNTGVISSEYFISSAIESGWCFGVFDLEYKYRKPESEAVGGKFYREIVDDETTSEQVLEQMDFPLVAVAMSYDQFIPPDEERLSVLFEFVPCMEHMYAYFAAVDTPKPEGIVPTGPKQVLHRSATATRKDYEGFGLMRILAEHLLKEARDEGFRGVLIESISEAVTHVWTSLPPPYSSTIVSWYIADTLVAQHEQGKSSVPFEGSKGKVSQIYVSL